MTTGQQARTPAEVVAANRGLAHAAALNLWRRGLFRSGWELDDLIQECLLVLVDAARTHDPARSALSTWFHCRLMGRVALRAERCRLFRRPASGDGPRVLRFGEHVPRLAAPPDAGLSLEDREALAWALGQLEPRERELAESLFGLGTGRGQTLAEQCGRLGVTTTKGAAYRWKCVRRRLRWLLAPHFGRERCEDRAPALGRRTLG
jgi:DNA-directed RNA polymerase specialized sigma24 family protein